MIMKIRLIIIVALFGFMTACEQSGSVNGIYRCYWGEKDGYKIWIVDGDQVRMKLFREFLYGGNEQRYLFNPKGEIWIDNAVSCEEFEMTMAHELNERHLMAKFGWTYYKAHDSSLAIEVIMRRKFEQICRAHEDSLPKMPVTDYENAKEIKDGPDSVKLQNIYRIPLGERNGIKIWVVDGYLVRKNIYPDFGFSGNDLAYHFIPAKEIWIDGQISSEETEYSIATELMERDLMSKGKIYDDAYEAAIADDSIQRVKMYELIRQHPPVIIPDSTTRDAGETDPNEPN
jgi:hypothetical protein